MSREAPSHSAESPDPQPRLDYVIVVAVEKGRSTPAPPVRVKPWTDTDLGLLRQANSPQMTRHLGGPESELQILDRHRRYLNLDGTENGQMFTIRLLPEGESVGIVGYWDREWNGVEVYEVGWAVLPSFQGRGLAVAGTAAVIDRARAEGKFPFIHAFPSIDHPASNGVCRSLGFALVGECEFEYPPGNHKPSNEWRLDLRANQE